MAAAIDYIQRATLMAGSISTMVTLNRSFPDNDYHIAEMCVYQTSGWFTNVTNTSFIFNVGTPSPYGRSLKFRVFHE